MNLSAFHTRIAEGESQTLKLKTSFDKATIESLVAFANTQGGRVLATFAQMQPESPGEGAIKGAIEGANSLFQVKKAGSGLRTPALAEALHTSPKNIERWLKQRKENGLIEFRGATKTGGYHAVVVRSAPTKGGTKT